MPLSAPTPGARLSVGWCRTARESHFIPVPPLCRHVPHHGSTAPSRPDGQARARWPHAALFRAGWRHRQAVAQRRLAWLFRRWRPQPTRQSGDRDWYGSGPCLRLCPQRL